MITEQQDFLTAGPAGILRVAVPVAAHDAESALSHLADEWMHSPGGRHIMRDLYALAAGYVPRWRRTGIPIAVSLLWEIERQRIKEVTARCQRRGITLKKDYGYTLNNDRRPYVSRHMMDRRPDWKGLFETRELRAE